MKTYEIVRADPSGNVTVFVLTDVEREDRPALAAKIMALPELKADQVAFVCPQPDCLDGAFEMMAGEFCGNASRAYGLLLARQKCETGRLHKTLRVSGCDKPITVTVDTERATAEAEMPLPQLVLPVDDGIVKGVLVHLGGIAHLVVEDVTPSASYFAKVQYVFNSIKPVEAYGICFVKGNTLTPLIRVPATNTLVFEGSCGSGALAAAVAMSRGNGNGRYGYRLVQPAGVVETNVTLHGGHVVEASIGGDVRLDDPVTITL